MYSQYQDKVSVLAIDTDPSESESKIREFRDANGYSWPMATTHRDVVRDYNITVQSSKVAVDHQGVIAFRSGYGTQSEGKWREWFEELAEY
ncbi:MAG: hypothetical protein FJ320_04010 [SAR202 cluster bacterium]|nr:hypothetical protein [SAR202 cluster bacterium]